MQRRLQQVRQQNPNADYATILGDFDPLLSSMLDERALIAFGNKYGFKLSKRLIDAEIAELPQAKGLNGQFSEQAYQASSPDSGSPIRRFGRSSRRTRCSG